MAPPVPRISNRLARIVLRAASAQRSSAASVLARIGLGASELEDPRGFISAVQMNALWLEAAESSGAQPVGVYVLKFIQPGDLGVLEYLVRTHQTVGSALESFLAYQRLIQDVAGRWSLEPQGNDTAVRLTVLVPRLPLHQWVAEFAFGALVTMLRTHTLSPWCPRAIRFVGTAPESTPAYRSAFGIEPSFGCSFDELLISNEGMSVPLKNNEPGLTAILDDVAAGDVARVPAATDIVDGVRSHIAADLQHCSSSGIAKALGLGERTLRRYLDEAGTSFSGLVEDVRRQTARTYLEDRNLAIKEVAFLLGFAEVSSFNRAFKRWFGCTPTQYRNEHQGRRFSGQGPK